MKLPVRIRMLPALSVAETRQVLDDPDANSGERVCWIVVTAPSLVATTGTTTPLTCNSTEAGFMVVSAPSVIRT